MSVRLISDYDQLFTIDPDLAVLSTRITEMLDVNTAESLEIDLPYFGDDINTMLECMQVLSDNQTNIAGDYIFYQVEPQISQLIDNQSVTRVMYIADYLEVEPLINILAYIISPITCY